MKKPNKLKSKLKCKPTKTSKRQTGLILQKPSTNINTQVNQNVDRNIKAQVNLKLKRPYGLSLEGKTKRCSKKSTSKTDDKNKSNLQSLGQAQIRVKKDANWNSGKFKQMKKIAMGNRNKMESKEIRDKWDEYINSMLDLSKQNQVVSKIKGYVDEANQFVGSRNSSDLNMSIRLMNQSQKERQLSDELEDELRKNKQGSGLKYELDDEYKYRYSMEVKESILKKIIKKQKQLYSCDKCGKIYKNIFFLNSHVQNKHSQHTEQSQYHIQVNKRNGNRCNKHKDFRIQLEIQQYNKLAFSDLDILKTGKQTNKYSTQNQQLQQNQSQISQALQSAQNQPQTCKQISNEKRHIQGKERRRVNKKKVNIDVNWHTRISHMIHRLCPNSETSHSLIKSTHPQPKLNRRIASEKIFSQIMQELSQHPSGRYSLVCLHRQLQHFFKMHREFYKIWIYQFSYLPLISNVFYGWLSTQRKWNPNMGLMRDVEVDLDVSRQRYVQFIIQSYVLFIQWCHWKQYTKVVVVRNRKKDKGRDGQEDEN